MGLMNDLAGLSAAYASMNQSDQGYLLTRADKDGNTPAWQNRYKINEATGKPLYKMADHLIESYENELFRVIDDAVEELDRLTEGKIPAGLQAYLDKKKGKKGNGDKKEDHGNGHGNGNGNGKDHDNGNGNGNGKKGSKPDFIDIDKDGDKKEPMKKAAKEAKTKKEEYDGFENSGIFTEEEVIRILWSDFEENYRAMRNPEKYKDPDESDKPYHKRSKAARMRDPERGINSPAFKKFMADRGM